MRKRICAFTLAEAEGAQFGLDWAFLMSDLRNSDQLHPAGAVAELEAVAAGPADAHRLSEDRSAVALKRGRGLRAAHQRAGDIAGMNHSPRLAVAAAHMVAP